MTLQAAIEAQLPLLRAEAEARMLDTWAIGTDAGWTSVDGVDVQTVTPLFTTVGRLTERGTQVSDAEVGGRTSALTRRELHIPWDSPVAPADAVAECIEIHESTDPTLLGTIVRLRGPAPASQKTARRLEVVEVLS